jgi:hypothetical protein
MPSAFVQEYEEQLANPNIAAEPGYIGTVIAPRPRAAGRRRAETASDSRQFSRIPRDRIARNASFVEEVRTWRRCASG